MKIRARHIATLIGVLAVLVPLSSASAASKERSPGHYLLALGDSISFGYQQAKIDAETAPGGTYDPATFDTGYVDVLAARLRERHPRLHVVNYSCPVESTATFIVGPCPFHAGGPPLGLPPLALHDDYPVTVSQLEVAERFLRNHRGEVDAITISLGENDLLLTQVYACGFDRACVDPRIPGILKTVHRNLDVILDHLRRLAPGAEIVLLQNYDLLGLIPENRPAFDADYQALNRVIGQEAATHRAQAADVYTPFESGPQPETLCRLTGMCSDPFDIHPTNTGYALIATVVESALDARGADD